MVLFEEPGGQRIIGPLPGVLLSSWREMKGGKADQAAWDAGYSDVGHRAFFDKRVQNYYNDLLEARMYAVIKTGGKQYKVSVGQSIEVERLPTAVGQTVEINNVLLLADNGEVVVGKPTVDGVKVLATVLGHDRGRRIIVFKFKRGNRYHRKHGHRQNYTRLRIEEIVRAGVERKRPARREVGEEPKEAAVEEGRKRAPAPIDELGLPARVAGTLKGAGIESVEDLLRKDEEELLGLRGFGAKSLEQVRASLKTKGFTKG